MNSKATPNNYCSW